MGWMRTSSVTTPSPMSEIASSGPLLNKHETFPPVRPAHNLPSLRLILRGVRQRPFVLDHLAEIAAIDPAIAGRAAEEMVGLVCRRVAETLSDVFAAREIDQGEPVKRGLLVGRRLPGRWVYEGDSGTGRAS